MTSLLSIPVVMALALLLDRLFAEFTKFHPLVGFGNLANKLEKIANRQSHTKYQQRFIGGCCWLVLVLPLPLLVYFYPLASPYRYLLDTLVLYLAIGQQSLNQHALAIYHPLKNKQLAAARAALAMIVSRDTRSLDEPEIARATVESVLENGHDGVIASLFYYLVGGAPLVIIHRLANTLDAMWGYKNERYLHFGWASARLDDVLGWPSAKITCLAYCLASINLRTGKLSSSIESMKTALLHGYQQGRAYKSLNGGWVMATGASLLNIKLGGKSRYHNQTLISPTLGQGNSVKEDDIAKSLALINYASLYLLIVTTVAVLMPSLWLFYRPQ